MSLRKVTSPHPQGGHWPQPPARAAGLRPGDTIYPPDEPQFDDDMDVLMAPGAYLRPEEA
ncbi:hypothetical protein [Breoghania sp. JC706]|uniref:hypothetical protein n=1 Tax=Breoghania sp. JC706 TaxID=3117732 RepID=UPI003009EA61